MVGFGFQIEDLRDGTSDAGWALGVQRFGVRGLRDAFAHAISVTTSNKGGADYSKNSDAKRLYHWVVTG